MNGFGRKKQDGIVCVEVNGSAAEAVVPSAETHVNLIISHAADIPEAIQGRLQAQRIAGAKWCPTDHMFDG